MSLVSRKCIPLSQWPKADQAAWNRAVQSGSVLDGRGPAAHWSEASRWDAQQGFGRWLAYLISRKESCQSGITSLDSERVANFVAHLETEVSAVTVKTQIKWLWDAIRVMAPDDDWDWLKTIVRQVSYRTKQQTQPPVVDSQCLFNLGLDLMRSAEVDDSTKEIVRATQYRDGLIIALLASRPLRRRTLASIHIGKQLKAIGGRWWLVFGPEDVKNRRALELPWPEALEAALQRYLARYRPCFDRADEIDALWVSQKGCALTADGIYQRISHLTREAFGEAVSPHRFRHAAASTISRHDPDHVMSITSVLGHASLDMAYRHYITAQGREASEAYQAILLNMRKEAKVQAKEKTRP